MKEKSLLFILLNLLCCSTFASVHAVYDKNLNINFDIEMNANFTPSINSIKILENGEIESLKLTLLANDNSRESKEFIFRNGKLQSTYYRTGGTMYNVKNYRKSGEIINHHLYSTVGLTIYKQNDGKVVKIERHNGFYITVFENEKIILTEQYDNEKQLEAAYPSRQYLSIENAIASKHGIKDENLSTYQEPTLEELLGKLKMREEELRVLSGQLQKDPLYEQRYSLENHLKKWQKEINNQADKLYKYTKIKFLIDQTEIKISQLKHNKYIE